MAIVTTVCDSYEFARWVSNSDSYSNNFSWNGAQALQEYLEDLSDDLGENIEFDPIAWCVGYTEFATALAAYNQYHGEDSEGEGTAIGDDNTAENAEAQALEWLNDNTVVIEFDGGIIVQDF